VGQVLARMNFLIRRLGDLSVGRSVQISPLYEIHAWEVDMLQTVM
jgi:hypothetical protein